MAKAEKEQRLMVLFKPKDGEIKTKLELLSSVSGKTMNDLVIAACRQYLDSLTEQQKKALQTLQSARQAFRKQDKGE